MLATLTGEAETDGNQRRSASKKSDLLRARLSRDDIGGSMKPKPMIEGGLGLKRPLNACLEEFDRVGELRSELSACVAERSQDDVARPQT